MISDNVLNTLITTLGTTIVSIVVGYSGRKTRRRLREMATTQDETSENVKHVKREMMRKSGDYPAVTTDVPVVNQPTHLGDMDNGHEERSDRKEGREKA